MRPRLFREESFCYSFLLHCDITLYGKVQWIDGMVLPQAVRYRHPAGSMMLVYMEIILLCVILSDDALGESYSYRERIQGLGGA